MSSAAAVARKPEPAKRQAGKGKGSGAKPGFSVLKAGPETVEQMVEARHQRGVNFFGSGSRNTVAKSRGSSRDPEEEKRTGEQDKVEGTRVVPVSSSGDMWSGWEPLVDRSMMHVGP